MSCCRHRCQERTKSVVRGISGSDGENGTVFALSLLSGIQHHHLATLTQTFIIYDEHLPYNVRPLYLPRYSQSERDRKKVKDMADDKKIESELYDMYYFVTVATITAYNQNGKKHQAAND